MMKKTIYIGLALAFLFTASKSYAHGSNDHVYQMTSTVQFVYTNEECKLYEFEEGMPGVTLLHGYALDISTMNRAEGCVAVYIDNRNIPVAEFRLNFIDTDGNKARLEQIFTQASFKHRESI